MPHSTSIRAPVLWTAYVLVPASGWGLFHGMPLGAVGPAALFAVWWIWGVRRSLPGRRALLLLLPVKILMSFLMVEHGFEATYYANDAWAPPVERSPEFRSTTFTRIDRRIVFGGEDEADFPLYFLNDARRPGTVPPDEPAPSSPPFSVVWSGDVWTGDRSGPQMFFIRSGQVHAEMWVDGVLVVGIEPGAGEAVGRSAWGAGRHHVVIRLRAPQGGDRRVSAGFANPQTGEHLPFQPHDVVARLYPGWQITADRLLRPVTIGLDAILLAVLVAAAAPIPLWISGAFRRGSRSQAFAAVVWVVAFAGGLAFARPASQRLMLLDGNALNYERQARTIATDGPRKMPERPPSGQIAPTDAMPLEDAVPPGDAAHGGTVPLYAYGLAAAHLIFGEDLAGVFLVQWLLACVVVLSTWRIATLLFGVAIGNAALALGAVLFVVTLMPLAGVIADDNIFLPLLAVGALWMIRSAAADAAAGRPIFTGFVAGLATLARYPVIAGWIVALPVLALARKPMGRGGVTAVTIGATMMGVLLLAALRNWIAGGPSMLTPETIALRLSMPGGVLRQPGVLAVCTAAAIGMAALLWGNVADGLAGPVRWVPAVVGAGYVGTALMIAGIDRPSAILPFLVLLLPYSALGLIRMLDFLVPADRALKQPIGPGTRPRC